MTSWNTKPKIATASAIIGVIVGASMGGQGNDDAVAEAEKDARALVQRAETKAGIEVRNAKSMAAAQADLAEAVTVKAAVSRAVAKEKAKRKRLIAKAVDKAVDKAKASAPEPRTLAAAPEATDPRFDTCGEANAAGYGNYRQGSDPEYDWYQDRDGDGSVCE